MSGIFEELPLLEPEPALTPHFPPSSSAVISPPASSPQTEGRGDVIVTEAHMAPSLYERLGTRDDIDPSELAVIQRALEAFDDRPRLEHHVFDQKGGKTDSTSGNIVISCYTVPAGFEGHISLMTVDAPGSSSVNPSAPFGNAASWAFIAVASRGTDASPADADTLRSGAVAFAPNSAAGPIIPGTWTFNDSNAPIAFGGETVYFVIHGGSQAALLGLSVQVSYRINLFSRTQ